MVLVEVNITTDDGTEAEEIFKNMSERQSYCQERGVVIWVPMQHMLFEASFYCILQRKQSPVEALSTAQNVQ